MLAFLSERSKVAAFEVKIPGNLSNPEAGNCFSFRITLDFSGLELKSFVLGAGKASVKQKRSVIYQWYILCGEG